MSAITISQRPIHSNREREKRYQELVEEVLKRSMVPEDRLEVAALLESMGWNDVRAAETFEVEDIFELASEIWDQINRKIVHSDVQYVDAIDCRNRVGIVDALRGFEEDVDRCCAVGRRHEFRGR